MSAWFVTGDIASSVLSSTSDYEHGMDPPDDSGCIDSASAVPLGRLKDSVFYTRHSRNTQFPLPSLEMACSAFRSAEKAL